MQQSCSVIEPNLRRSMEWPALKVTLLGQFGLALEGVPVHLNSQVAQSVFAYLALNAHKALRREKLAGIFWPEMPDVNARGQLRHTVWRIRKAITASGFDGFAFIPENTFHIQFCVGPDYELDVAALLQPVTRLNSTNDLLTQLVAYDELLPGFNTPRDEWICEWHYRLEQIYTCKALQLIDRLIHEGRHHEALEWGSRLMRTSPHLEPVQHKMVQAFQGLASQWHLPWPVTPAAV